MQLFKIAAEAFREVCQNETDAVLLSSAQAKPGAEDIQKLLAGRFKMVDTLNIIYRQQGRQTHLLEPVYLHVDTFKKIFEARLHFQLTTTAADTILLADPPDTPDNDHPEMQVPVGKKKPSVAPTS